MELGRGKFCTKEQWDIELDCQVRAQNRHNDQAVRLQPGVVQDALAAHEREQGFWLTQEQRGAVEFVTMRSGGVACVSGFAGSGKTATAGAYIKAFEASGYTVIGTSTSQKATDNLAQEGKIKAFNTAALLQQLDNGKMTLPEKCVVILDEAGMVGAKTFQRLQHHIDARGGKLVAVGDALQLQPIQAGSPFRHVVNDIGDTKQTEIRRQKNQELNKMANDWYGGKSGVDIVSDLKSQGRAVVGRDHEVKNNLVQDYLASSKPPQDKLIIAQTRDECRQVSDLMREQMKAHGKLGFSHSVEIEREESKVKIKERLELAAGDRIRLTRNQKNLGLVNGDTGKIERIEQKGDGFEIVMKHDDGRTSTLPPTYKNITHGYASTVHAAQGLGKSEVYWLNGKNPTDRNMAMVAMTRSKDDFKVYSTPQRLEKLAQGIDEFHFKKSAQEIQQAEQKNQAQRQVFNKESKRIDQKVNDRLQANRAVVQQHEEVGKKLDETVERWNNAKTKIKQYTAAKEQCEDQRKALGLFDFKAKKSADQEIAQCDIKIAEHEKKRDRRAERGKQLQAQYFDGEELAEQANEKIQKDEKWIKQDSTVKGFEIANHLFGDYSKGRTVQEQLKSGLQYAAMEQQIREREQEEMKIKQQQPVQNNIQKHGREYGQSM